MWNHAAEPHSLPDEAQLAVNELRALFKLSRDLRTEPNPVPQPRVLHVIWDRLDEGVACIVRMFPGDEGGRFPLPRILIALTARWLGEGAGLLAWLAEDPAERARQYSAGGADSRWDLAVKRMGFDPAAAVDLRAHADSAPHAPRTPKLVQRLDEQFGPVYAALCEVSHWNSVWVAGTMEDRPAGDWILHLEAAAAFYRHSIAAAARAYGFDVDRRLRAIPLSWATRTGHHATGTSRAGPEESGTITAS